MQYASAHLEVLETQLVCQHIFYMLHKNLTLHFSILNFL